jgi:hypothetical protein
MAGMRQREPPFDAPFSIITLLKRAAKPDRHASGRVLLYKRVGLCAMGKYHLAPH